MRVNHFCSLSLIRLKIAILCGVFSKRPLTGSNTAFLLRQQMNQQEVEINLMGFPMDWAVSIERVR